MVTPKPGEDIRTYTPRQLAQRANEAHRSGRHGSGKQHTDELARRAERTERRS